MKNYPRVPLNAFVAIPVDGTRGMLLGFGPCSILLGRNLINSSEGCERGDAVISVNTHLEGLRDN
jgi:hypothetical protein